MDWCWTQPVDGPRLLVLLALAKRVQPKTEVATPSMPELMHMTGMSETTIRSHLQALARQNVITVEVSNGGRRQRSTYTLTGVLTPRELWGSKPAKTPREATPRNPETPRIPRQNPPGDAPVVPKREQEVVREAGAEAPAPPAAPPPTADFTADFTADDGGMFEKPTTPASEAKARNNLAQAITNSYERAVPLSNRPAVLKVIRKAVDVDLYSGEQINAAALRVAADGRSLTTETLRIELEGFGDRPANGHRNGRRGTDFDALRAHFKGGAA